MVEPLLWAQGLGVERGRVRVLHQVDLAASSGEILAILGPNGAGKSTLLRTLVGLQPYRGTIRVAGDDLTRLPARERAKRLAFVPQQSALRSALPVREVVAQGRYAHTTGFAGLGTDDHAAIEAALDTVDAGHLSSRAFTHLSLGEQRRVLIARALCTGARALCLDEPTAAFDVGHALQLYRLLHRLAARGHGVIVVLHQLDDALRHADRALLLAAGVCVRSGPVAEVIAAESVREVYGVEMQRGGGLSFRLPPEGG